jgi:hypothetical protein
VILELQIIDLEDEKREKEGDKNTPKKFKSNRDICADKAIIKKETQTRA